MNIRSNSKTFPDWAQSFLSTFYSPEEMVHEASINVKTLPKVVWNDNTFYVSLDADEGNADILNEYGNVVAALKNVTSINEVEQQLNKQIIAEVADKKDKKIIKSVVKLDDELEKVADAITQLEKVADEQAPSMKTTDPSINKSVDTVTNTPSNTTSEITTQQMDNAVNNDQITNTASIKELQEKLKNTCDIIKADQNKINKLQQKVNSYEKKVAKMSGNIVKLANTIKKLQDQIHAYMNPGNIYDLNCQEQELKHYTQTAEESAKAINVEHQVDLTTPQGRVSLKDRILQDIEDIKMPEEILTETVEISPVEQVVNEVAEEEPKNMVVDNNIKNNEVTIIDNSEENVNNKIEEDNNKQDEIEENKQFLDEKESSIFKQRICPLCKESTLCLDTKTASIQNILCHNCKAKFGVNLNNEKIFKY